MALIVRKTGDGFPSIEAGNYQAVCYAVIDLGTHYNTRFGYTQQKVCITWEVPELRIDIVRNGAQVNLPRAISQIYTSSLSEKSNLYRDLVAWRGKPFTQEELDGFDLFTVLGANCLLQIINTEKNGKTYANVANVAHLVKGMSKLKPENSIIRYSMPEHQMSIPEDVPEWIQTMIRKSQEFQAVQHAGNQLGLNDDDAPVIEPEDDDIPF